LYFREVKVILNKYSHSYIMIFSAFDNKSSLLLDFVGLKVGDLPEEDVAPPENVLFVCKLNPVTTEDDLEVIFSRFGNIKRYD